MSPNPDIIVLIPHYNDLEGLYSSLESISDVEPVDVIVVDDGSEVPPSLEYLEQNFGQINKINLIILDKNQGIEKALNEGLKFIQKMNYKYIARLDCSDICHPNRFKLQKDFMDSHPDIHILGTFSEFIDNKGNSLFIQKNPISHKNIKKHFYFRCPLTHPTVMFRKEIIDILGFYPEQYKWNEDYDYFFKIIRKFKSANLPEILVKIMANIEGISYTNYRYTHYTSSRIILNNFEFKYFFYALAGLLKHTICLILGGKFMYKLYVLINPKKK